jgi:hypothetical protein
MEHSTSATGSGTSTRFLYDGDYVRLRDLVLDIMLIKQLKAWF